MLKTDDFFLKLMTVLLLVGWCGTVVFAADEELLGRQAEQAGNDREALTHYVNALPSVSVDSRKDQELRGKIIGLARKVRPAPAVPEEAERRLARGNAAVKSAADREAFKRAADEFKAALKVAPWLAEGYFNLGVVQDKAGDYPDAIRNLKFYLLSAPDAKDAKEVRNLIYEIEYRQEEAQRATTQSREISAKEKQDETEKLVRDLAGKWIEKQRDAIAHYQFIPRGGTKFTLEYLYTVRNIGTSNLAKIVVNASMEAGGINGKVTRWYDYSGFNCKYSESIFDVTGTVSRDGMSIVLVENHRWVDPFTCQWEPARELVTTLTRDR